MKKFICVLVVLCFCISITQGFDYMFSQCLGGTWKQTKLGLKCDCGEGKIRNDVACSDGNLVCESRHGENSYFKKGECFCSDGYIMKDNKCVSEKEEKKKECGTIRNSKFDENLDTCSCRIGYVFDGKICISEEQFCKEKYGRNSIMGDFGECICKDGYEWNRTVSMCVADRKSKLYGGTDFRDAENERQYRDMISDYEENAPKAVSIDYEAVISAQKYLGEKAKNFDYVVSIIKTKEAYIENAEKLIKIFKSSTDEYTKNAGIYLEYLMSK